MEIHYLYEAEGNFDVTEDSKRKMEALKLNLIKECRHKANYFDSVGVPERAVWYYGEAVKRGDIDSLMSLGKYYSVDHNGMEKDLKKAEECFRKAAEGYGKQGGQGDMVAQYDLGDCYRKWSAVAQEESKKAELSEKSEEWYKKAFCNLSAAKVRDAGMNRRIGLCYREGHGTQKDAANGTRLLKLAAEQGDAQAFYAIVYSDEGTNITLDWFKKAAEKAAAEGDGALQNRMGDYYLHGKDKEFSFNEIDKETPNFKKALSYYKEAAKQGQPDALYVLSLLYEEGEWIGRDSTEAVQLLSKATDEFSVYPGQFQFFPIDHLKRIAEQSHPYALYCLGLCYENAYGVEHDPDKAFSCFEKAVELDEFRAKLALARAYEGRGDVEKAIFGYIKEAICGNKEAVQALERLREQRDIEIEKYFEEVVAQGDTRDLCDVGCMYYSGKLVKQDFTKAVALFRKAVENDKNSAALYYLGECYENGRGVVQSMENAVSWYTKAAELGDLDAIDELWRIDLEKMAQQGQVEAQNDLGKAYYIGTRGVGQNFEKAVAWYTKAADQGYYKAQNNLAVCYEYGEGVKQNLEKAVFWYTKAAEQGSEKAKRSLERIGNMRV